jgi:hypothetical protein
MYIANLLITLLLEDSINSFKLSNNIIKLPVISLSYQINRTQPYNSIQETILFKLSNTINYDFNDINYYSIAFQYGDYYQLKHKCKITYDNDYLLICQPLITNYINPITNLPLKDYSIIKSDYKNTNFNSILPEFMLFNWI